MADILRDLERLQNLREAGVLNEDEFQVEKDRLLSAPSSKLSDTVTIIAGVAPTSGKASLAEPNFHVEDEHEPKSRKPLWLALALVVASMIGFSAWWHFGSIQHLSDPIEVWVSGIANARTKPTADGSKVVRHYDKGTELMGRWVSGSADPSERWLEVKHDGKILYVWSGNLSETEPTADTQHSEDKARNDFTAAEEELAPASTADENIWKNNKPITGSCKVSTGRHEVMRGQCSGLSTPSDIVLTAESGGCTIELNRAKNGAVAKLYAYRDTCWLNEASELSVESDIQLGYVELRNDCWIGDKIELCVN